MHQLLRAGTQSLQAAPASTFLRSDQDQGYIFSTDPGSASFAPSPEPSQSHAPTTIIPSPAPTSTPSPVPSTLPSSGPKWYETSSSFQSVPALTMSTSGQYAVAAASYDGIYLSSNYGYSWTLVASTSG